MKTRQIRSVALTVVALCCFLAVLVAGALSAPAAAAAALASLPTSRPLSATDRPQLLALMTKISGVRPALQSIGGVAIIGKYTLLSWSNGPIGFAMVATERSGSWVTICHDKGGYTVQDLLQCAPQMGLPTANALFKGAQVGVWH
ncbi:MAG: hypothetical protein IAI50_08420 [Candidatus Eremiobacteraeota bacterium]|nr:hypothetical protein [Candidatus Eremiobacteraeota bacterium]